MFSLITSLIAIALVIALAVATIYYGGTSSEKAATRAAAATLVNQAGQINAAGLLAVSSGAGWPAEQPSFGEPYLRSMPVPPKSAYADVTEAPSSSHWTYYIPPASPSASHHFVLKNKISRSVCMAVNKGQGLVGIPAVWDGKTLIQCFGPGVAARAGSPLGYTFFYDPAGTTAAQKNAALAQSKDEGGSGTPGYPRSCPDGSTIETGLCLDAPVVEPPSSENGYSLSSVGGVLTVEGLDGYGDNYQTYCSADLPLEAITPESTLTVGQLPASIDDTYTYIGMTCIDSYGNPPHAAGTLEVVLSNSNGSTARGTIEYVDTLAPAPTLTGLSPKTGLPDVATRLTIYGQDFKPGVKVFALGAMPLPVTFINSGQIEVTMPAAAAFGPDPYELTPRTSISLMVFNRDSDYVMTSPYAGEFEVKNFEYREASTTEQGEPVQLSVSEWVPEGGGSTYLCPVAPESQIFANGAFVKWGDGPETSISGNELYLGVRCIYLEIPPGAEGETTLTARTTPDGGTTNFIHTTAFTYKSGWFKPGTHQVKVTVSPGAAWMPDGYQTANFAEYRAVEDCSHLPGIGASIEGHGEFCIPALHADYEVWAGYTGAERYNGEYYQTGFVLTDGTHTYTFLHHYRVDGQPNNLLTMFSGAVAGPLGEPDRIPAPPNYGCDGYCYDPR